jgi:hypothetical protein
MQLVLLRQQHCTQACFAAAAEAAAAPGAVANISLLSLVYSTPSAGLRNILPAEDVQVPAYLLEHGHTHTQAPGSLADRQIIHLR